MNKDFNYENLYLKHYKNIPNYYFWGILFSVGIPSTIAAIVMFASGSSYLTGYATALLVFGWPIGFALGAFWRWITSIALSQKIVVADSLLTMRSGGSAPANEDLPEL